MKMEDNASFSIWKGDFTVLICIVLLVDRVTYDRTLNVLYMIFKKIFE